MALRIQVNNDRVRSRIIATLNRLQPESRESRAALFRIGTKLRNDAIENLTSQGAVDEGLLRSSLQFTIETSQYLSQVVVHTSGRRYARIVELGGAFTDAMRRAMFASLRARGRPPRPGKGIVQGGRYRARPYMSPAAARARASIVEEIRKLTTGQDQPP